MKTLRLTLTLIASKEELQDAFYFGYVGWLTANYAIQVLNTIGNRAARDWRMRDHWTPVSLLKPKDLELDKYKGLKKKRKSVPLTWEEQEV